VALVPLTPWVDEGLGEKGSLIELGGTSKEGGGMEEEEEEEEEEGELLLLLLLEVG
jgi:hypothetical protein